MTSETAFTIEDALSFVPMTQEILAFDYYFMISNSFRSWSIE